MSVPESVSAYIQQMIELLESDEQALRTEIDDKIKKLSRIKATKADLEERLIGAEEGLL